MWLPLSNHCTIPAALSTSRVRAYPPFGTAATKSMRSAPEHRVQMVPPTDVVAALWGAVVGGPAVLGGEAVVGGVDVTDEVGVDVEDPPEVGDGATVPVEPGPGRFTVVVDPRPETGGVLDPVGLPAVVGCGERTVVPSARSTPRAESRATPGGATWLATLPTAPNASATLAVTPTTHKQVSTSPRLIS